MQAPIPTQHRLPLNSINAQDRVREDYGTDEMQELCDSIREKGLIQPVVVNQDGKLIAGGRRYTAFKRLDSQVHEDGTKVWGDRYSYIDVVYRETLDEESLRELELEENIRRKDMSWQELALGWLEIHNIRVRKAALAGDKWTQQDTGLKVGVNRATITQALPIARLLRAHKEKKDHKLWELPSFSEAIRFVLQTAENAGLAELQRRQASMLGSNQDAAGALTVAVTPQQIVTGDVGYVPPQVKAAMAGTADAPIVVDPGKFLFNQDCLTYLANCEPDTYDFCITDPPYNIDMDNLAQDGKAIAGVDSVRATHIVGENDELLARFIPAVYRVLKPNSWFVMWCDYTMWESLRLRCEEAGFKSQRWPLEWLKPVGLNQAAGVNFTKASECAVLARKGSPVLVEKQSLNWKLVSNDAKTEFSHPFAKPRELWEWLLSALTQPQDLGLEPFAGQGSGVLPALRMYRTVHAVEVDPEHFKHLTFNVKECLKAVHGNIQFSDEQNGPNNTNQPDPNAESVPNEKSVGVNQTGVS